MVRISILAFLILTACSSKDQRFCDCLSVGDELNNSSHMILNNEETDKTEEELIRLKNRKDSLCEPYQTMSGEEMLAKKDECGIE